MRAEKKKTLSTSHDLDLDLDLDLDHSSALRLSPLFLPRLNSLGGVH